jgi:DNA (cytosine-5)-methyltransferase 1
MKYFSMFSGIGGFEYGLEQSKHDFECVGYSEIDKYARSIYERHYPNHTNYGDATRIDTKDLPDFEFLVGGFPCQAFSIAGKRRGFNEARGTLFFEIARILRDKQPRYFLLENVKGLLSHEGGETLETIFRVCDELGYNVSWAIYNSCDYGVPQNRERIFIKGYFRGKCGQEVLSVPRVNKSVDEPMSNTYYGTRAGRVHKEDEIMNTLSCQGHNGGGSQLIQLNNDKQRPQGQRIYDDNGLAVTLNAAANNNWYKINKVGNVRPGGNQGGMVYGADGLCPTQTAGQYKDPIKIVENRKIKKVGNVYKGGQLGDVYDSNGLSPTCCAGHSDSAIKIVQPVLTPDRENKRQNGRRMKNDGEPMFTLTAQDKHGVYDGMTVRKLTPVECERLQGFPDNWTKYGKDDKQISDTQRYKCCGNAVTTNVITAIVDEMFDEVKK